MPKIEIVFQIIIGLLLIVFNKQFVTVAVNQQNKLGFVKLGENDVKNGRVFCVIFAIILISFAFFQYYSECIIAGR